LTPESHSSRGAGRESGEVDACAHLGKCACISKDTFRERDGASGEWVNDKLSVVSGDVDEDAGFDVETISEEVDAEPNFEADTQRDSDTGFPLGI
jgi:hypothetical protein